MQRSALREGVDYAIGRAASHSERVRATFRGQGSVVVAEPKRWGGGKEDRTYEGLEFELVEPWPLSGLGGRPFPPSGITLDPANERRAIVENARLVINTWVNHEEIEERARSHRERSRREFEGRQAEASELRERLEALGLEGGQFRVYADPRVSATLSAKSLELLLALVPEGAKVAAGEDLS